MTAYRRATEIRVARILALIAESPLSSQQIADALHCSQRNVSFHLERLLPAEGGARKVYIAKWGQATTCGTRIPLYQAGNLPDAPLPKRQSTTEVNKRYWAKMRKENPDVYMRMVAKKKARRLKPRRDPMTEALFGVQA